MISWLIWSLGVLFYIYDFLIRVSPNLMVADMMRDFAISGAGVGALSAWYLYVYAAMQVPVGLVLDRFGARRLLALAALCTACGCVILALAPGLDLARTGRLLNGLGGSASFLGSLMLAATWLPRDRYAVFVGLTMMIGTLGAMVAEAPLALAIGHYGWRDALLGLGLIGFAIAALLAGFVRDQAGRRPGPAHFRLIESLKATLNNRQVWMLAVVDSSFAGPMLAFGGLWGVPYLIQVYGLSPAYAAELNALMLIGWGAGAPAVGWLSDRVGRRKAPLVGALCVVLAGWLAFALLPGLPLAVLAGLYLVIGVGSGGMFVGFALVREVAPPRSISTAGGVMNTLMTGTGAALQPLVGWLLDLEWTGRTSLGERIYSAGSYAHAVLLFVALQAIALVVALRLRESYCRPLAAAAAPERSSV